MNVLDLFSGIGGFSLGLERAGMRTVAFCEIDPFCRKVLAKNFPGRIIYDDVRTLTAARLVADAANNGHTCGPGSGSDGQRMVSPVASTASGETARASQSGGCGIDLICGGF